MLVAIRKLFTCTEKKLNELYQTTSESKLSVQLCQKNLVRESLTKIYAFILTSRNHDTDKRNCPSKKVQRTCYMAIGGEDW